MILHKLEMFNFRQYIGEQIVEFSTDPNKNVTVLIGVNTSGKTTIVRAFEWCLYGKNGFEDPVLLNSDVRDNMNIGDEQNIYVSVTFEHNNKIYTLKREYFYKCKGHKFIGDNEEVELTKPEQKLTLEYLQQDGQTKTPIDQSNIMESMDRVLPKDLSDYFFFGGERISGIANRTDLSKAVRGLMRLDILENAKSHLNTVVKNFSEQIDTSGDANAQRAKDSLETFKVKKAQLEEEALNFEEQMNYWNDKEKEYGAKLAKSNINEVKKAQQERNMLEKSIISENAKLEKSKKDMVHKFNNRPYAFFGLPVINKTLSMLKTLQEEKGNVECVPDMEQGAIDYLIKRGYCICGTHLDKGSIPYLKIMEERKILPPEYIGSSIQSYKNKAEGYLAGSENFKDEIEEKYKEIRAIERNIGVLQDQYNEKCNLIIDDTDAKDIEGKRRQAHTKYVEASSDFKGCQISLGGIEKDIKNCESAIDKYAKSSVKNQKVARYIMYSQEIYDWLASTYKDKEEIVREELQKRVNENFAKMYHGERSIIIDDKYRVKYKDVTTEESDGLKAVKSFAFIASLVSMAKDKILDDNDMKLGQVYPLVMDAPFSNVDEIHIDNICKILPNTANQVIMAVMKKDWEYASNNLQKYVGKSYTIEKDHDASGKEIDTSTHIK